MPCEIVKFGNFRLEGVSVLKGTIDNEFSKCSTIRFFGKIEDGFFWWNLWNYSKTQKNGWFYLYCVSNEIIAYENSKQAKKFLPGAEDDSFRYKTLIFFKTLIRGLSLLECVSNGVCLLRFQKTFDFCFFLGEPVVFLRKKLDFFKVAKSGQFFIDCVSKCFFINAHRKIQNLEFFRKLHVFFEEKILWKCYNWQLSSISVLKT